MYRTHPTIIALCGVLVLINNTSCGHAHRHLLQAPPDVEDQLFLDPLDSPPTDYPWPPDYPAPGPLDIPLDYPVPGSIDAPTPPDYPDFGYPSPSQEWPPEEDPSPDFSYPFPSPDFNTDVPPSPSPSQTRPNSPALNIKGENGRLAILSVIDQCPDAARNPTSKSCISCVCALGYLCAEFDAGSDQATVAKCVQSNGGRFDASVVQSAAFNCLNSNTFKGKSNQDNVKQCQAWYSEAGIDLTSSRSNTSPSSPESAGTVFKVNHVPLAMALGAAMLLVAILA